MAHSFFPVNTMLEPEATVESSENLVVQNSFRKSEDAVKIKPWMAFVGGHKSIIPTWLRWFVIWQIVFFSLLAVMQITNAASEYETVALGATLAGFFFTWTPCHICRSIENLHLEWEQSPIDSVLDMDWESEGQKVISSKLNYIGIAVLFVAYSLFYFITAGFTEPDGLWFSNQISNITFSLLILTVFLIGGWATAFFIQVSLLPMKLKADESLPPSPWEHHMQPLRTLSGLFLVLSLYGAMVVICVMIIALNFPPNLQQYAFALVIVVGLIALFAFIFPQLGVHQQLKEYKDEYLLGISIQLEKVMVEVKEDPTAENLAKFEQLMNMHDRINALDEWPFNIEQLGTVMASVFIPMGAFIFEAYL